LKHVHIKISTDIRVLFVYRVKYLLDILSDDLSPPLLMESLAKKTDKECQDIAFYIIRIIAGPNFGHREAEISASYSNF
jgi:hypothetical protein